MSTSPDEGAAPPPHLLQAVEAVLHSNVMSSESKFQLHRLAVSPLGKLMNSQSLRFYTYNMGMTSTFMSVW